MGIINNITMLRPIKGMQMLDRASVGILFRRLGCTNRPKPRLLCARQHLAAHRSGYRRRILRRLRSLGSAAAMAESKTGVSYGPKPRAHITDTRPVICSAFLYWLTISKKPPHCSASNAKARRRRLSHAIKTPLIHSCSDVHDLGPSSNLLAEKITELPTPPEAASKRPNHGLLLRAKPGSSDAIADRFSRRAATAQYFDGGQNSSVER